MKPQTHRLSTCHRHPTKPITGFCAPCLSERLAGLDSAAAAHHEPPTQNPHSGSELRRCKSCAGTRPESSSENALDPTRRKSCDVRARNTLSELFNIDDDRKGVPRKFDVEVRDEEKNEGGDEGNVLDLDADAEFKTMKELIDLEWEKKKGAGRDLKDIAGTFWGTTSVLCRKVRQWRRKQKMKKVENEGFVAEKRRETQSEVGEYALGRRSCDTDPDPGRMSMDEPRASWDGYLGPRAAQPRLTRMVSVVEENWERSPGGSAQTKDYYNSQRRRSFERPSFDRSLAAEVDELKLGSNARVSPASSELFYGAKLLITEKELMSSMGSNSKLKPVEYDERAEEGRGGVGICSEPVCKNATSESTNGVDVDHQKLNRRHKKWSFWGLMQRRSEKKCVDEESTDSWQKLRMVANGEEANASVSQKLIRSYSVSCRNQCKMVGLFSNVNGVGAENKCNEVKTLQRNKSARYSPSNLDHGLLRFYLTPLRSYRRSESGKGRPGNNSQSLPKNVL
ncbi:hypothetical protein ACFX13_006181 [Malus domestica]|uniref:protein OCTOPUS-like n=1 Tax=Malus domestica TaxID=3750 RepID=UPI00397628D6